MCNWNESFFIMGNVLRGDNKVDEAVIVVLTDDSVLIIEACIV